MRCVWGMPWSSRSGGPLPPCRTQITASPVSIIDCLNPSNIRLLRAPVYCCKRLFFVSPQRRFRRAGRARPSLRKLRQVLLEPRLEGLAGTDELHSDAEPRGNVHHERVDGLVNDIPGECQIELHDTSPGGQRLQPHESPRAAQVADERCRFRMSWLSNDRLQVGVKPRGALGADLTAVEERVKSLAAELVAVGERSSKLISHRFRDDRMMTPAPGKKSIISRQQTSLVIWPAAREGARLRWPTRGTRAYPQAGGPES